MDVLKIFIPLSVEKETMALRFDIVRNMKSPPFLPVLYICPCDMLVAMKDTPNSPATFMAWQDCLI